MVSVDSSTSLKFWRKQTDRVETSLFPSPVRFHYPRPLHPLHRTARIVSTQTNERAMEPWGHEEGKWETVKDPKKKNSSTNGNGKDGGENTFGYCETIFCVQNTS
jgi:hypothetical protein